MFNQIYALICNYNSLINHLNIHPGYDTLPIDSMQGLEIGGQQQHNLMGLNTGPPTSPNMVDANMMDMECVIGEMDASELTFSHHMGNDMIPSPPIDNTNQVAAWYDTDL